MPVRTFQVWVTISRAPDLPDKWEAFCLDLNVVTYGDSLPHALTMVVEASRMVIEDDLSQGLDPLERRAPQGDWDDLYEFLRTATVARQPSELQEDHVQRAALTLEIAPAARVSESPGADTPEVPRGLTFAECA